MRRYIIGVLVAGLLSFSQADSVKTRDGHSYQGTVQYSDADTIKLKLADSGEVKVFSVNDVAEVLVDSSAARPAPPKNPPSSCRPTAEYWERQGYADGSRTTGLKATLAGVGGCIGVPLGGPLGVVAGTAAGGEQVSFGRSLELVEAGCLIGAAAGGAVGCLGGSALGSFGQREAISPTSDSVSRDAYLRGYQRGVRFSNNVSLGVGAGGAVLSVGIFCLWGYLIGTSIDY